MTGYHSMWRGTVFQKKSVITLGYKQEKSHLDLQKSSDQSVRGGRACVRTGHALKAEEIVNQAEISRDC